MKSYRMRGRRRSAALALLTVVALAAPAGADHTPIVDASLGEVYKQNFNETSGDWTAFTPPAPPTTTWEWGVPTSGPAVAASGDKVWATELDGPYKNNDCGAILSEPIDLSSATAASVSFKQWRHMEEGSVTAFDAGLLFVTTDDGATYTKVAPAPSYNSKAIGATARACLQTQPTGSLGLSGPSGATPPAPVYSDVAASISAFAGQTVRFAIAFGSDGSVTRAGWYIDDFTVTIDGVSTVEDFEADNGGFTVKSWGTPKAPIGWQWGTQASGPGASPGSDPPLWGTNLAGSYGPNECSYIESPAIDLRQIPADHDPVPTTRAILSWSQWFRSSSANAGGVVQVVDAQGAHNVKPTTGYPANPSAVNGCLGNTDNGGAFAGTINSVGAAMVTYKADITPYLGSEIKLRYLFGSTESTPGSTDHGWYVDDVALELKAYVGEPHPPAAPDQAPGWTAGGTNKTWAWGTATNGPKGEVVYGTGLAGNYNMSECSFIDSPAVPGALLAGSPTLQFTHWYRIESVFSNTAWDGGVVLVSTDDGATWTYLALPQYTRPAYSTALKNCLGAAGIPGTASVFSGVQDKLTTVTGDLSAFASAPTVKVRFLFGTDSSVAYEGWYVKSVSIAGVPVLA